MKAEGKRLKAKVAAAMLAVLALFAVTSVRAAVGDMRGNVRSDGWSIDLYPDSMATNGVWTFAYTSEGSETNIPTATTPYLLVQSPGSDTAGNAVTNQRVVYLTKIVRLAYPGSIQNAATNDETIVSGQMVARCALSHHIFSNDVVTLVSPAGFYSKGGTNSNVASNVGVTNSSVTPAEAAKVIGNWTWPGYNRITNSTMRLRAVGFHASAHAGRPVEFVSVITTDQHGHTNITSTSNMSLDTTLSALDAVPSGEYVMDVDISGMTQGDLLRSDLVIKSAIGGSNAWVDTRLNTWVMPTAMPSAQTNYCDKNNLWKVPVFVVDITAGATPLGKTNADPTTISSVNYCGSIAQALSFGAATNLALNGSNVIAFTEVYVRSSVSNWMGASLTYGTNNMLGWAHVQPYPGHTVTLTNQTGNNRASTSTATNMIKVTGIGLGGSANHFYTADTYLWLDQCTINSTAAALWRTDSATSPSILYVTDCTITNMAQGILNPNVNGMGEVALVRGCNMDGFNNNIHAYTSLGNSHPSTNGANMAVLYDRAGQVMPLADGAWIVYNNDFRGQRIVGSASLQAGVNFGITNGVAIVQCLFEVCTNGGNAYFDFGSSELKNSTNILVLQCTFLGSKNLAFYNWAVSATTLTWRTMCILMNCFIADENCKADVVASDNSPNRFGNWEPLHCVGWSGNVFAEMGDQNLGAPGNFLHEFCGLRTIGGNVVCGGTGTTNTIAWPKFVNYQAQGLGNGAGTTGGGNYRVYSDSPLQGSRRAWILAFDMQGKARSSFDPAGVYVAGRRTGGAQ